MMRLAQYPAEKINQAARPRRHRLVIEKRSEIVRQPCGAGVAMLGIFLQTLAANELQIDIDLRIERAWPHRLLRANEQKRLDRRRREERRPARQQLIQDCA